jgi:subtilisin family serine protease
MLASRGRVRSCGLLVLFCGALNAATPDYAPGRLLVRAKENANPAAVSRTLALHRAAARGAGAGVQVLSVPEESSAAVMASLRDSGLFEYVERDYYAHTAAVPNDPLFSSQWYLPTLQVPQAWDVSASGALVAVIDSGVDATHPDLAGKLVTGWNFLNGNTDTSDTMGHGTAVAGTLAAAANNGVGTVGVSAASQIMPLVVVSAEDLAAYSDIAAAIQYAADRGVRVINISIGGAYASAALQSAVDYAWNKGAVVFAAAMNTSSSTPYYPAACTHALAVAATDSSDRLASFSNFGDWVSLSAPGSNILAPLAGGGYGYWYGTSFSAPIAAGVAALSLAANPALTNAMLVDALEQNADDLGTPGKDPYYGWGRVNALRAVTAAKEKAIAVSVAPPSASLYGGQSQQFTATAQNSTAGVTWTVVPPVGAISASGVYTAPATVAAAQTVTVTAASVENPSRLSSVTVRLLPPSIAVTPGSVSLKGGGAQPFTAAVTGSSEAVVWTISPAVGSISASGVYTAPAVVAAAQTVTVTASVTNASASALVILSPGSAGRRTNSPGGIATRPVQRSR